MPARKTLVEISAEMDCGEPNSGGFDAMLSDFGISYDELIEAAQVGLLRTIAAQAEEPELPVTSLMVGMWFQGCVAGIAYARKRENLKWPA